eukprot:c15851_g1_i1.p1 GENE.c15851_g1_i1~~c15851_g1_i1.p1  ORF type:complete len:260 (-),score=70.80 c15851_g1_i1:298-1077(-)
MLIRVQCLACLRLLLFRGDKEVSGEHQHAGVEVAKSVLDHVTECEDTHSSDITREAIKLLRAAVHQEKCKSDVCGMISFDILVCVVHQCPSEPDLIADVCDIILVLLLTNAYQIPTQVVKDVCAALHDHPHHSALQEHCLALVWQCLTPQHTRHVAVVDCDLANLLVTALRNSGSLEASAVKVVMGTVYALCHDIAGQQAFAKADGIRMLVEVVGVMCVDPLETTLPIWNVPKGIDQRRCCQVCGQCGSSPQPYPCPRW